MVNVAEKIKKALFEKGWTQRKLCNEIEMSENGYKKMVENQSWKLETLEKIANALELPLTFFITNEELKFDQSPILESDRNKPGEDSSFGSQVIEKVLEEFRELKSQLSIKDKQIDGLQRTADSLQRTVDALLGNPQLREKSFNKPVSKAGKVIPLNSKNRVEEKEVA